MRTSPPDSPQMPDDAVAPGPIRAAQYVRMSTEHQKYSTANQSAAISRYADERGYDVVRSYSDDGKSGLTLNGRVALKQLIADVQSKRADFQVVLVFDVSRWGRFQDIDESAYYEFICKSAGVKVVYCAEQFENDGSMSAALIKSLKRTMAAEYTRALLVTTNYEDIITPDRRKHVERLPHAATARLEQALSKYQHDYKSVSWSHGDNTLCLTVARGYVANLLRNPKIEAYLRQHYPQILADLRSIMLETTTD